MKKIATKLLAALLTLVLCFSAAAQPLSAAASVSTNAATNLDEPVYEVQEVGVAIAKAATNYIFGRAIAELSSWSISNDVPVIGSLSKLMLNPSQRAALKQSAQVTKILATVTAISASVQQISAQLSDISNQLSALDQKTDLYHAAELLNSATQFVNDLAYDYEGAWAAYCNLTDAVSDLAAANDALAAATDPEEIEKLAEAAEAASNKVVAMQNLFIQVLNEGGGMAFFTDITNLEKRIYDAENPTASYLGALEAYLRLTVPFEHQITEQMTAAAESCAYVLFHIFLIYSEYYTYLRAQTEEENKNDPDAKNPYDFYTDEYFDAICNNIVKYFDEVALASGIANFMVAQPMSDQEIAEYREIDANFVAPESIDTIVTVNGVNYSCYKVRANSDRQYYLIFKGFINKSQLVQTSSVSYFSYQAKTLCRPGFVLDHEYSDDGYYRLISENELPDFVKNSSSSVLSYLRLTGGLLSLPQDAAHILLRDNTCKGESGNNIVWDLKAVNVSASGGSATVALNSSDINSGKTGTKAIAIYRLVGSDAKYKDGTYQVLDKSELENKTVFVGAGQTLDLTKLTVDVNNVTIRILGDGKIVSNPKITLKNSRITVVKKSNVTLENLKLTAQSGNVAALMISAAGSVVNFVGTNSFSGTAAGSITAETYYANYTPGMPIGASHGVYAADNTILSVSGTTTFSGAGGGAGVCVAGKFNLVGSNGAKVVANGSTSSVKKDADHPYFPLSVGAGIGGSASVSLEYATDIRSTQYTTIVTRFHKYRSDKSSDFAGSHADIQISGITLEAKGANTGNLNANVSVGALDSGLKKEVKDITLYSDDIGGVNTVGTVRDVLSGSIKGSTVNLKQQKISGKINTKLQDNFFNPEVYTFTVFTHGSQGTTKDGISFMLEGADGRKSEWITASECGVEKGTWTGSFVVDSVGELKYLQIKSNREGDKWFGGEVTVSAQFGGETLTLYGGRFISTTGDWLYPWDDIYQVTVETGTEKDSGTDADILFNLKCDNNTRNGNGSDSGYRLDNIHWEDDAFEKGDVATFLLDKNYCYTECLGFYLSSDCSGRGPQWKVDKVSIKKVQGDDIEENEFTISTGYWFRTEQTVFFGRYSGSTGAFYIEVKTSDVSKAGTDSNIYLTVNGSKGSTGEIELDLMAEDGDNFERGDLDTMCIGFDTEGIGEIQSITIRKDDAGSGADWHLEYITIREIIADDQTPQSYKFTWNDWIEDETVTLTKRTNQSVRRNAVKYDRDVLSGLTANADGSYTLTVDRETTLSESAFKLIAEKSAVLNVVMENDGKPLYEVIFDGSAFESWRSVTLGKNYSFADGKSLFTFLQNVDLPENTKIRIHAKNIGFLDGKSYQLYSKDENDNWTPLENIVDSDGVIEFYAKTVKELMLLDKKNAWVVQPDIENYVSGETPSEPVGEALFGTFTVRYTGTADDGTSWDSADAPTKAGKYTAVFTVEAGDGHDALTCEVDFEVTPSTVEPIDPTEPTQPTEPTEPTEPTAPEQPQEKAQDLTWLYVAIAAVVMFGAGFGVSRLTGKKKKD